MEKIGTRTDWTPPELAAEIADIIRTNTRLWGQTTWFGWAVDSIDKLRDLLDKGESKCGSTACVSGWAGVLTLPAGTKVQDGTITLPDGTQRHAEDVGREALSLTMEQASWLFNESRDEDEVLAALDAIANRLSWEPYEFENADDEDEGCGCSECCGGDEYDEDDDSESCDDQE